MNISDAKIGTKVKVLRFKATRDARPSGVHGWSNQTGTIESIDIKHGFIYVRVGLPGNASDSIQFQPHEIEIWTEPIREVPEYVKFFMGLNNEQ